MHLTKSISRISDVYTSRQESPLPEDAGVYAFWWLGDKESLLNGRTDITLKGPSGAPVQVKYENWWPDDVPHPCLYIGKSTNIKKRFAMHIRNGTYGRMHEKQDGNDKGLPKTTSCQLRFGIEHVFPDIGQPLELIHESVGFSYEVMSGDNAVVERFFKEDLLIGQWRPWFNIDSER